MSETKTETAVQKIYPCDESVRGRLLALLETGVTKAEISRGSGINSAIVTQYTAAEGNKWESNIEKWENLLNAWLNRRELELLSGIPTIDTPVSEQMEGVALMLARCGIMGKVIGESGIGKTRGATRLKAKDPSRIFIAVNRETASREGVKNSLFKQIGLRRSRRRKLETMEEFYKRLRATKQLIIWDDAHKLSSPAVDLAVEIYNATAAPQMFIGTSRLEEKIARDEQWASRLNFTWPLDVAETESESGEKQNHVRALVAHQVRHRLPEIGAEIRRVVALCEKIALADGHFRRVEMRLNMMLFLGESPKARGKDWSDLFEMAAQFLPGIITD